MKRIKLARNLKYVVVDLRKQKLHVVTNSIRIAKRRRKEISHNDVIIAKNILAK